MKKIYFLLLSFLSFVSFGQGFEDFTNSTATASYGSDSFIGNDGITWSYVASRDGNADANGSGINLPALMLRRISDNSRITSSTISGGITDFSVKLYKGFTGAGDRQVELFVNGVSFGTSTPFDSFEEQVFTVSGINVPGNIVIEIVNATSRQVIIDDISWTGLTTSCGVTLGQGTYTCNSSTVGDNNDGVTINVPYSGIDATLTSVSTTSAGTIGGDNPATVADGVISITGLSEGAAWDVVLNGGECDGFLASGTVPASECDPIPNTCFDLSAGPELFELVEVVTNSDNDVWTVSSGTYTMNGFCGGGCAEESNTWLIFGPLDMTGASDLQLLFDASESFDGTDLNIQYTNDYSSNCPDGATWTSAQIISETGSYSIDLAAATGAEVFVGIQYLDNDGSFSSWSLANVSLAAFGSCPTLGTRPTSDCGVCGVTLQTETYTCLTNTDGDNNDGVTVSIPYSGVDGTIASITAPGATLGGDDPALTSDGTIVLSGLTEGDAWSIILNGVNCDGTALSGTIPVAQCDPEIVVINEINADPSNDPNGEGDANGDGIAEFDNDEFVEIYNTGSVAIDMENFTLEDAVTIRHTFPAGTILQPNSFMTIFGGGTPTGIPGLVQVSSTGTLSLNNGGDTVTIRDNNGVVVVSFTYGNAGNNQSIGRSPDFTGSFVDHSTITGNGGALFSPNRENDTALSTYQFNGNGFSIYPNPTQNGFVTISSSNDDAMVVQVFDILGKQVKQEKLTNNTLNVSDLNSGIYIVKITQNEASTTKKLVIK